MTSFAPQKTGQRRRRSTTHLAYVCVVDPHAHDYHGWEQEAEAGGIRLRIAPTAEAALRLADAEEVDLWVVNTRLPGLSGHELCGMLKSRSAAVPVYLVADEYSAEAEREAFRQRATLFGTKPAHRDWLDQWGKSAPCRLTPPVAPGH